MTVEDAQPAERWVRRPGVVFRRIGGSLAIGARDTGEVMVASAPAALIWDLLGRSCDIDELVERLCASTGAEPTEVRSGLVPLLCRWSDCGWLERR